MIGNDVIDIRLSRQESNWQRKGFKQKLFTEKEQLLLDNDLDPEILVWLLWSMKEAAYKILHRQTKIRAYIPKKLVCTIGTQNSYSATGRVDYCGNIYHTKTTLSHDLIHTVAVVFLKDLDYVIEIENKDILKDDNGIPYLFTAELDDRRLVSVSNHGRFEKVVTIGADKRSRLLNF